MIKNYEAIVVGAGHAGIEAALALSRKGHETLLLTLNFEGVGYMACNPAIGGTAKGHLVREIDALGGEMGVAADKALLQLRMLNLGKGPAVHSLRGQEDKAQYHRIMLETVQAQPRLTVIEAEAEDLIVEDGVVKGVATSVGNFGAKAVVLTCGVYLESRVITGEEVTQSGPSGFPYAAKLSKNLAKYGLEIRRFKTGTPARIARDSIDYDAMELQAGDETIDRFSFLSDEKLYNQRPCYLTYTNAETHRIIKENLHRAPLYNGSIKGVGPRYCPSIEDKVMRFADKERHQIFIEPEGADSNEMYIQGMSSSMPKEVQELMYHSIRGLERAVFIKYAYAIEYDCLNPLQLLPSLKVKSLEGLYSAGQINGSSGYEEAAAQGLIAGLNAALWLENKPPYILTRDRAYVGVLIDDLVTKGTNEPYRMMTARAEYRLHLRQDNADLRLTEDGYEMGLATEYRYKRMQARRAEIAAVLKLAKTTKIDKNATLLYQNKGIIPPDMNITVYDALKRAEFDMADMVVHIDGFAAFSEQALTTAETEIKYEGYLLKEETAIRDAKRMEDSKLPDDVDYLAIKGLRIEARQKLNAVRPLTLGQASRISGVSPADVAVLIVYLSQRK